MALTGLGEKAMSENIRLNDRIIDAPAWVIELAEKSPRVIEGYVDCGGVMAVYDGVGGSPDSLCHDSDAAGHSRSVVILHDDSGEWDYEYDGSYPEDVKAYRLPAQFIDARYEDADYEIGGQTITMKPWQAEAWNAGDIDEKTLEGATIFLPSRVGMKSYVRDGEVIVEDGLPTGESASLWSKCEDENYYTEYLEGNPARRIA